MIAILFLILVFYTPSPAAFERVPQSPLATGSALSYFLGQNTLMDFISHPADLAHVKGFGFTVFRSSPFGLEALGHAGFTFTAPLKTGALGTGFAALGQTEYRETALSVGTGRRLGQTLEAGILMNVFELYIAGYQSDRTLAVTGSVSYTLAEGVRWSILYRNLNRPHVGRSRELLPQIVSTGITVSPTINLTSTLEMEKELEYANRYKFGLLWQPLSSLVMTTGFATHPGQVTAGIAVQFPVWNPSYGGQISYGLATHPELANTQVVCLQLILR